MYIRNRHQDVKYTRKETTTTNLLTGSSTLTIKSLILQSEAEEEWVWMHSYEAEKILASKLPENINTKYNTF